MHLGTGAVTNAHREEKKISVFLSLEMAAETWKEGCAEELMKVAHIKIESRCEPPPLFASIQA